MKQILYCLLFLSSFLSSASVCADNQKKTVKYVYEDNKQLVDLVEDAAALVEEKGQAAFKEFSVKGSRWFTNKNYIFVYDDVGTCVFHPVEPTLKGQNLRHFIDVKGTAVIVQILEIGKMPQPDASGWVFYLWEGPWHTYPLQKGSYIHKAVGPDGKEYLVGSGLYDIKIEKAFVEESVDRAVALICRKGKDAAFNELSERSCPLHVLNSYIEVTDTEGNVVVDPLFPKLMKKRNVSHRSDLMGRNVFMEIKESLADKESTWIFCIKPTVGSDRPEKHLYYFRKVKAGNEVFYVGAGFVPAAPIWMK